MGDGVYAVSEMRYQAATKVRCRFYEAAHEAECSLLISFESGRAVRKNGREETYSLVMRDTREPSHGLSLSAFTNMSTMA